MPRNSTHATRAALIDAAERLFAERGLDAVSLSAITKAAGQRNASALQYHFGGKDGLVQAILEKHQPEIDRRRHAMLDELEASGCVDLHGLLTALVLPLARKLRDPNGGACYISLMAQLISSPTVDLLHMGARDATSGRDRLMRLVAEACPAIPAPVMRLRTILVSSLLFRALADFDRVARAGVAGVAAPDETLLFAHNLRDCLVAMLEAPLSPETEERARSRQEVS